VKRQVAVLFWGLLFVSGLARPDTKGKAVLQKTDTMIAYGSSGFQGSVEYDYEANGYGNASVAMSKKEDWDWKASAKSANGKLGLSFGVGYLGNSFSIRPRPFTNLLLKVPETKPLWATRTSTLLGSSYPSEIVLDAAYGNLSLIGAAKMLDVPISDLVDDVAQVFQAKMELVGVEYTAYMLGDTALALSFCMSHLPFRQNSGGWTPTMPTTMESSFGSLSAALAFPVENVAKVGVWASLTQGYFDPLGAAVRAQVDSKTIELFETIEMGSNFTLFAANKEYRLVDGSCPTRDGVLKANFDARWHNKELETSLELDSAEGWPFGPRAANSLYSPLGLAFQYLQPTSLKALLAFSADDLLNLQNWLKVSAGLHVGATCSVSPSQSSYSNSTVLTKLDLLANVQIERTNTSVGFGFGRLRLGPKCSFSRFLLEESTAEEIEQIEDPGSAETEGDADSDTEEIQNPDGGSHLFLKSIGCLFAFDWNLGNSTQIPAGSIKKASSSSKNTGKVSFAANYHKSEETAGYWAFQLVLSQQFAISQSITGTLVIRSPSGGWQTRPGKPVMPTLSLAISAKSGSSKD